MVISTTDVTPQMLRQITPKQTLFPFASEKHRKTALPCLLPDANPDPQAFDGAIIPTCHLRLQSPATPNMFKFAMEAAATNGMKQVNFIMEAKDSKVDGAQTQFAT